jgi:Amt family ammonium transporter
LVFSSNHTVSIIRFIQAKFAIITPALITGALLNEFAFGLYAIHGSYFTDLCPLCHMTWHPDGLFFKMECWILPEVQ